jgi:hypothetical protein
MYLSTIMVLCIVAWATFFETRCGDAMASGGHQMSRLMCVLPTAWARALRQQASILTNAVWAFIGEHIASLQPRLLSNVR